MDEPCAARTRRRSGGQPRTPSTYGLLFVCRETGGGPGAVVYRDNVRDTLELSTTIHRRPVSISWSPQIGRYYFDTSCCSFSNARWPTTLRVGQLRTR